jgi:hypothetical protein
MSAEDLFELSQWQQWKLLDFIDRFDQTFGERSFDPQVELNDAALLALALRRAQLLGLQNESLEKFFETEFGLTGLTGGNLETILAITMLSDAEKRILVAAGGRN